jgi:hypothetical protein
MERAMKRASVIALRAAAAFAKDKEDLAARINSEIGALQLANQALTQADDPVDFQSLVDARDLVHQSIQRLAQLRDALERSDISTRRGNGVAALSTAESPAYRGAAL